MILPCNFNFNSRALVFYVCFTAVNKQICYNEFEGAYVIRLTPAISKGEGEEGFLRGLSQKYFQIN